MASVSSIDNQRPLLPQPNENSYSSETESIMPFGEWLQQKSEIKEEPQPIKFKESEQTEEADQVAKEEEKGTRLFAETPAKKSKQTKSLFKEQQTKEVAGANKTAAKAETTEDANLVKSNTNQVAGTSKETEAVSTDGKKNVLKASIAKSTVVLKGGQQAATDRKASSSQNVAKAIQSTPVENLKSTKPVTTQPNQVDSLAQLKTNVKAIFNSLTPLKTSVPSDTTTFRVSAQKSGKQAVLSMDKMKPIRLTNSSVTQKGPKQDGATTIQHLKARKSIQLDPAISSSKQIVAEAGVDKLATKAQATGVPVQGVDKKGSRVILPEDSKIAKKAKGRKRAKAKSAKLAAQQRNHVQHAMPEGTSNTSRELDTTASNNQLQSTANQLSTTEFMHADSSSSDGNPNNLFGRSESGASVSTAKQSGKTAQAYASRSLSWLKTLSDKTSQINRQDPNWKMLEMKLDKGDGEMTIKVMRNDEQVSISVQFTDDALRAQAESQSNQILESLKEHYGEDVNFSFTEKKGSSMDSPLDQQAARRRRLRAQIEQAEKPVQVNSYDDQGPDQHQWIG
ncbi:MAG: hypothetical protein AB8G77_16590 [Rhodothermales bacterium]